MSNELVLDQRIVWDKCRMKEVEQAKGEIMNYKRQGYRIEEEDGKIGRAHV